MWWPFSESESQVLSQYNSSVNDSSGLTVTPLKMQVSNGKFKSLSPKESGWDGGWREGGEACGKIYSASQGIGLLSS